MILYKKVWDALPEKCTIKDLKEILGRNFKVRSSEAWEVMKELKTMGYSFQLSNYGFKKRKYQEFEDILRFSF